MEYKEILEYLYGLERFGTRLGLERILKLLEKLGNPHKALKIIHVAGTNGKGSVCAMVSSVLVRAGYKAGMYTSPHLRRFRERFLVNGAEISKEDVVGLFEKVNKYMTNQTFFEVVTAMAFLYFKEKKVDFLVLEVGLGGRLDATNVVEPLVSVITNISLEHTDYLGKSVKKIAYEKAGIIKKGKPAVTGCKGEALKVIKKVCEERGCRLFLAKRDKGLRLNLEGDFQVENASVAVKVIGVLKEVYKIKVGGKNIVDGLKNVKWSGRLQFLEKNLLVDCAHNPAGMEVLKKEILKIKKNYKKIVLVIGVLKDKDYKKILSLITPIADSAVLTKVKMDRAAEPEVLSKYTKGDYKIVRNVKEAVKYAKSVAGKNDLVLVTGSIYVVGKAVE